MIDRRRFVRAACAGIAMHAAAAHAQQPARVPRIAGLFVSREGTGGTSTDIVVAGLQELGYVDGRTISYEWRWWEGKPERLRAAAAELVALKPDVIVVGGSEATRALKEATRSIPIVFMGPSYPVEEGLVASLARPGGNVTGVSVAMSDYVTKLLQLLLDVVPGLAEVALIWSPDNAGHVFLRRDAEAAGRLLKLKVLPVAMASPSDVEPALAAVSRARPGALVVLPGPIPNANADRIAELGIRLRMPSMTATRALVERGLLMSYGPDFQDLNRRIPAYVDRILKGARPAEMPVERPTTFELRINLKTAKAIGLVIPPPLLARADAVVR